MRKFSYFFGGLVIAIFSVFFTSCETDSISYGVYGAGGANFLTLHSTYDNFLVGKDTLQPEISYFYKGVHLSGGDHVPADFPVAYVDLRFSDGHSNWSDPRLSAAYLYQKIVQGSLNWMYNISLTYDKYTDYIINANSPPAHLHLCLRSWDENTKGKRPGRTWKVKSIVDDKGNDLTKDPDWENYTDNTMRFEKTDRFVFTVGEKRSKKEEELFGLYPKNDTVYGTYNFGGKSASISSSILYLVFPDFKRQLTVVESAFGMVKLSGIEGGKTGILVLEPID